jgi:hypothetical protein
LFNEQTAFIAGLFVALAPFQVHYSQEIRMYAFLAMWLVAATYAYWQGSRTADWRWWGVFAITCALAQYTHNLAAFYLIPLALTPVLQRDWRSLRATVLAGFAAVILYTPWLIQLPAQFAKVSNSYWVEKTRRRALFYSAIDVYIISTAPRYLVDLRALLSHTGGNPCDLANHPRILTKRADGNPWDMGVLSGSLPSGIAIPVLTVEARVHRTRALAIRRYFLCLAGVVADNQLIPPNPIHPSAFTGNQRRLGFVSAPLLIQASPTPPTRKWIMG